MDTTPDVSADRAWTPVEPMGDFHAFVLRSGTVTEWMLCRVREVILVRDRMGQAQWRWITDMLDGAQNGGISSTCRVNGMQLSIYQFGVRRVDGDGDIIMPDAWRTGVQVVLFDGGMESTGRLLEILQQHFWLS